MVWIYWCCLEATKVKSTILHQIIDATSESCGTYQMKNNHVGKLRPCFCNLRNIIANSGILVYPIIINDKPLLWLLWIAYYWVYHMRISLRHTGQRVVTAQKPLKTPFFFATPCRWDAPKVCPKWVTWRNRKLRTALRTAAVGRAYKSDWNIGSLRRKICQFWWMLVNVDHTGFTL